LYLVHNTVSNHSHCTVEKVSKPLNPPPNINIFWRFS